MMFRGSCIFVFTLLTVLSASCSNVEKDYLYEMNDIICTISLSCFKDGWGNYPSTKGHFPSYIGVFWGPDSTAAADWAAYEVPYKLLLKDLYDLRAKSGKYRPQHMKLELEIEQWLLSAKNLASSLEYASDRSYRYTFSSPVMKQHIPLACPTLIREDRNGHYDDIN
ncbi:MAG: hypothetical protein CL739_00420, partial [Chloroflexi bacterium]|nr:hypothetical protein [Chloroflexota bacterium]